MERSHFHSINPPFRVPAFIRMSLVIALKYSESRTSVTLTHPSELSEFKPTSACCGVLDKIETALQRHTPACWLAAYCKQATLLCLIPWRKSHDNILEMTTVGSSEQAQHRTGLSRPHAEAMSHPVILQFPPGLTAFPGGFAAVSTTMFQAQLHQLCLGTQLRRNAGT